MLTISLPREQFSNANIETLQQIVTARAPFLKITFLVDSIEAVVTDTTVSFPWFPFTSEPSEVNAYSAFVTKLCNMARRQKRVVTPSARRWQLGYMREANSAERCTGNTAHKSLPTQKNTKLCGRHKTPYKMMF